MNNLTKEVLLVDDDAVTRKLLLRYLETILKLESGVFIIHEAVDGRQALQLISAINDRLNLVISDVCMPAVDGNVVAREAFSHNIPVIMTTATESHLAPDVIGTCSATLIKPICLDDLKAIVIKLLLKN